MRDAIGRRWQCSTVQFDFNLPVRFDLSYVGPDGASHRPFMVHRALFGSLERFFALLLEHHAGALPTWMAPVQAVVLPVGEDQLDASRRLADELLGAGVRCEVDEPSERLGARIRRERAGPHSAHAGGGWPRSRFGRGGGSSAQRGGAGSPHGGGDRGASGSGKLRSGPPPREWDNRGGGFLRGGGFRCRGDGC